jgi:aminoglycoside 3-N-acetyltransferase
LKKIFFDKLKRLPNHIAKRISKKIRVSKAKQERHLQLSDLQKDFENIGIQRGDTLLVHSALSEIGFIDGGPKTVIRSLVNVLDTKEAGNLVIPVYFMHTNMYKTCLQKDYVFDVKTAPTVVGAIPKAMLKTEGVYRSIHPTHSIAAKGKDAKFITEKHHIGEKTFGENSPFAKVVELNGKILGLGINLAWHTIYHHVEDIMDKEFPVKVKMDKIFHIPCKNNDGVLMKVGVQPLDLEISQTRIEKNNFLHNYFWEICSNLRILRIGKIGKARSWLVNAREFVDLVEKLASIGITIYSTEKYLKDQNLFPYNKIKDRLK